MNVSELNYRFWIPSQNKFLYPKKGSLTIEVDQNGNQTFFLDWEDISEIDSDFVAQAMSNYSTPAGPIYEGDILRIDKKDCEVKMKNITPAEFLDNPYDDYEVDFFVEIRDNDVPLSDSRLSNYELVGDIFNGVWVEDEFANEVQSRAEILAERRRQKSEELRAQAEKSSKPQEKKFNPESQPEELNSLLSEEISGDYDDQEYNSDYDGEIDDETEEEEISSDNQRIDTSEKEFITLTKIEDIGSGVENPETQYVSVDELGKDDDDHDFDEEFEFDSDEDDWDWTEDDYEDTDLFNRNSTQGFEELFIKFSLDRDRDVGAWAVGMYHFGLSKIISGVIDSADVNLLQMTALHHAFEEITIPSTIRINLESGFLKKLLAGKLDNEMSKGEYQELYTSLLDDSSRHNFVFVGENPYSRKIEGRIAQDKANQELYDYVKKLS